MVRARLRCQVRVLFPLTSVGAHIIGSILQPFSVPFPGHPFPRHGCSLTSEEVTRAVGEGVSVRAMTTDHGTGKGKEEKVAK